MRSVTSGSRNHGEGGLGEQVRRGRKGMQKAEQDSLQKCQMIYSFFIWDSMIKRQTAVVSQPAALHCSADPEAHAVDALGGGRFPRPRTGLCRCWVCTPASCTRGNSAF